MKRALSIIVLLFAFAYSWAQGIGSAKDLQAFIEACNKGESVLQWADADSTVYLSADIDMKKAAKMPQLLVWNGKFDGRGHKLTNWKPTLGGLIKTVGKKGVVRGIVIDSSCLMKISSKGDEFKAGFIADSNDGLIADCVNYGTIQHKCSYTLGPIYIGGIVGFNRMSVTGCRNEGAISSDTSGDNKEGVFLSIGGISGGSAGKGLGGCVIARCENTGAVSCICSLSSMYVGGITGNAAKNTVKYCINRGNVKADIRETEDGKTNGLANVAGIAGGTKADIIRCRNYGPVKGVGACASNAGGIAGMPHDALVIADCINYGAVTTEGEQPSNTGGIVAGMRRPVHVRNCINYGTIRFDGVSSRARSTAGGIVGNIHTVRDATAGAYVRNCLNYGKVHGSAGGNKYDASNRNAIHAAGIVAYAESRPGLRASIVDCSNFGSISCDGRKGEIIGSSVEFTTGGAAPDVYATNNNSGEASISGFVKATDGTPLHDVIVTDGEQCTRTAADGSYSLSSNLDKVQFVYISIPAWASVPTLNSVPQFFRRIPRDAKAVKADFVLEKHEVQTDYTLMMIADPQVRPYGMDGSMEAWATIVAPDAEAFRASQSGPVYSINLGDLVYNYMYAWDDYMDVAAQIHCPTFNVIGNHDFDQNTLYEIEQGDVYYETYVGPTNYSFEIGDLHFVVMNDIMYDRPTPNDKYYYGLDERTMKWLENDLSYVPKDKTIMICTHAQMFKSPNTSPNGSHSVYYRNYKVYRELFASYKKVYSWCGHYHQNYYYNYAGKDTRHGAPNIECISVARCTGALRLNRELGAMGEPQGYMVVNVHGTELDWYYKSVGHDRDYQMRAYPPSRTVDGSVKVNIWNWSEGWSTPEWYEGGEKIADMEFTPGVDPDYYDIFETVDNQTTRKYCKPSTESVIFSVHPTPGATSGEIRVSDMFGKTYTLSVNLE